MVSSRIWLKGGQSDIAFECEVNMHSEQVVRNGIVNIVVVIAIIFIVITCVIVTIVIIVIPILLSPFTQSS